MSVTRSRITMSLAQTESEISAALQFCGEVYERSYGTHWTVAPDVFFVAKEAGEIVATGGLTFAARHEQIASERYFRLSDRMKQFIGFNRERVAEFGRFASVKTHAAQPILYSALQYCMLAEVDFLFAWANPSVSHYMTNRLGLNFWPIPVPLDLESALGDTRWASPPNRFFERDQPPALHMGVVPLWDYAIGDIGERCAAGATAPEWRAEMAQDVRGAMIKSTSVLKAAPRLLSNKTGGSHPSPYAPLSGLAQSAKAVTEASHVHQEGKS